MLTNIRFLACVTIGIFSLGSCTKEETKTEAAAVCATTAPNTTGGYVVCPAGSPTTFSFDLKGGAGEQYVVAAYALGDHSTVKAASSLKVDFGISATSASLQSIRPSILDELNGGANVQNLKADGVIDERAKNNALRIVANRFDSRKGLNQEEWMWPLLESLSLEDAKNSERAGLLDDSPSLLEQYKSIAEGSRDLELSAANTAMDSSTCPATVPNASATSNITVTTKYEGTKFCIVYDATPTAETKENLEKALASILSSYKDSIYEDQMTTNVKDGYSFAPIVVYVGSLSIDGAFNKDATTLAKRPVLHIKSTLSKALLHSTLAHEMQHAIVDYYKARGTTTLEETVAIDEGVAHLMEDAFGYGEDNFTNYAKSFLSNFVDLNPILGSGSLKENYLRGGAYSLMYFIAQRAGGFTVTNGKPFSGAGMKGIASLVKQTTSNGPAAVATAFGLSNLTERVGELIGAMYNDNRGYSFAATNFTSATYSGITDVLGATGLKFGLRFAGDRSFTGASTAKLSEYTSGIKQADYYSAAPIVITPSAESAKVTYTLPAVANVGITVARIK
jgi:hypothetical protein